ncbi:uncharacterized protein LOC129003135 [Macrosteles quadrilineatus]|uniref:uncharacterized protein LOC129003135 n=1 Tax=Macrosteles quadrilineatus TaxID=74068 RepID=UPI0023E34403|nr:uncharacterized protein LOC129003135 [Macrosteles quadrilineatus]
MAEGEAVTAVFEIDSEQLIRFIEERPVLWDKTVDGFRDRSATREAWQEVCIQLCNDFEELEENVRDEFCKEIMKRWKNLRDAFAKEVKDSKKPGPLAKKKRKYIFYERLKFLSKIYEDKETDESCNNVVEGELELEGYPHALPKTKGSTPPNTKRVKRIHFKKGEIDNSKCIQSTKKENRRMSFFESLLPHVEKFDDDQWLQCQMNILQVICEIKNTFPVQSTS